MNRPDDLAIDIAAWMGRYVGLGEEDRAVSAQLMAKVGVAWCSTPTGSWVSCTLSLLVRPRRYSPNRTRGSSLNTCFEEDMHRHGDDD